MRVNKTVLYSYVGNARSLLDRLGELQEHAIAVVMASDKQLVLKIKKQYEHNTQIELLCKMLLQLFLLGVSI